MDLNTCAQKDVLTIELLDELLDVNINRINNRIMARNTKEPVDWSYDVGTLANGTKCKNNRLFFRFFIGSFLQLKSQSNATQAQDAPAWMCHEHVKHRHKEWIWRLNRMCLEPRPSKMTSIITKRSAGRNRDANQQLQGSAGPGKLREESSLRENWWPKAGLLVNY